MIALLVFAFELFMLALAVYFTVKAIKSTVGALILFYRKHIM